MLTFSRFVTNKKSTILYKLPTRHKETSTKVILVKQAGIVKQTISHFVDYLEEISHMDEVRKSQARVMNIKQELRNTNDKKREIIKTLEQIRQNQHYIYSQMKLSNNRGSDQYLQLVRNELELCTKEKKLQDEFAVTDTCEYGLFNEFSTAITDSYEKEKLHSNFLKVMGMFGTICATLLTLIASVMTHIYQQKRLAQMRIDIQSTLSEQVVQDLQKVSDRLADFENSTKSLLLIKSKVKSSQSTESWGTYLNRNTRWLYAWALPRK